MDDTINMVEQLESGEYQRGQIKLFEDWARRNKYDKKEINQVTREIVSGQGVYFDSAPGESALRLEIMKMMRLNETRAAARMLEKAVDLISRQQEYIGGPYLSKFEMEVAVRMRFTLCWND